MTIWTLVEHPCVPGAYLAVTEGRKPVASPKSGMPDWWPCWAVRRTRGVIPLDGSERWKPCQDEPYGMPARWRP
jgi:hypothetical protein